LATVKAGNLSLPTLALPIESVRALDSSLLPTKGRCAAVRQRHQVTLIETLLNVCLVFKYDLSKSLARHTPYYILKIYIFPIDAILLSKQAQANASSQNV